MRSDDLRRPAVWLHRLRFALDETEQLCVHLVFQRRRHSVRRAFVDFERRVLHDLRRQHRGGTDREVAIDLERDVVKEDRKSTRLNSSHMSISYAVFCLKKKKK